MSFTRKFYPVVFSLVLISLCWSGCQSSIPSELPSETSKEENILSSERKIGVIQSLGGYFTSTKATHLLRLEDGNTLLLRSDRVNLDDPKYNQKKVAVSGELTKTGDGNHFMLVLNIDILEDNSSSLDRALGWENYQKDEYGLHFKYRNDFELIEEQRSVKLIPKHLPSDSHSESGANTSKLIINVIPHLPDTNLLTFLKIKEDSSSALLEAGFSKTKIGKQNIISLKKETGQQISYHFDSGIHFYELVFESVGENSKNLTKDFLEPFLSSIELVKDYKISKENSDQNILETNLDKSVNITSDIPSSSLTEKAPISPPETLSETVASLPNNSPDKSTVEATGESNINSKVDSTEDSQKESLKTSDDYALFESDSFKFSIEYPKSYYFDNLQENETGVMRRYGFGKESSEEQKPSELILDITQQTIPPGNTVKMGESNVVKESSQDTVSFYLKGKGSRVYKLTGPNSKEEILLNMIGSLQEKP